MRNCGMVSPFVTWAEGLRTQTVGEDLFFWSSPNFGRKTRLNLSEDLFFGLHLTFDRKNGLIVGVKVFILDFLILRFSESPGPPF